MSQKHVAELVRARKSIKCGYHEYICHAVRGGSENIFRLDIIRQIESDLSPDSSLGGWLRTNKIISDYIYNTDSRMKATRLAWIDALIEYWKDK